ncbi:MAG: NTP transferase domain-containing protein [Celeribacter marinus]
MRVLAGICAAGSSTRMGFDKLAAPLPPATTPHDTCLTRACAASAHLDQCVILPAPDHPYYAARKALIGTAPSRSISGPFSNSLKALASAAHGYDGLLIQLADMPHITRAHITVLMDVFETHQGEAIVRASDSEGRAGHPVLFPSQCFGAFEALDGDIGAHAIIARYPLKQVVLSGDAATFDLDTPAAWQAFGPSAAQT